MHAGPAPTFLALEAANRRRSNLLLIGVFVVLVGVGAGIGALLGMAAPGAIAAAVLAVLISAGAWWFGDLFVLRSLSAQELPDEAQYDQLRNVVAEMSIAAGLPPPRLYLLDHPSINAFATGLDPQHASLGVTRGAIEQLDREELQGVVAHEMSHIANLDTRFALLLATLVGSVALLTKMLLNGIRGSRSSRGRGAVFFLIAAAAIAGLGWALSQLISLAVSRQREYLADATAVELTRNPTGIEEALTKMFDRGDLGSFVPSGTQHMFAVAPRENWLEQFGAWGATHPPVQDRVNRLRALRHAPALDQAAFVARVEELAPSRAFLPLSDEEIAAEAAEETETPQERKFARLALGLTGLVGVAIVGSILLGGMPGGTLRQQVGVADIDANTGVSARAHVIYSRDGRFYDGYLLVDPQTEVGDRLEVCIFANGDVALRGTPECE